jgi:DNA repair exonuclease SbcCD nuclease subunit
MPHFLHASDLHLDAPLDGLDTYPGAPVDRLRGATRRALERLVALAIERRVAFVVLAGDIYDTNPLVETAWFFRQQMQRLHDAKIPAFIVRGNHDHAGVAPRNVALPSSVRVFAHDHAETFEAAEGVFVHGRSYPRPDYRDDLAASYPAPIAGALNLGVLHTCLDDTAHAPYAPTSPARLLAHGYAYWALGHVHRRRIVREGDRALVFPGNLQGRHARETGAKGAVIVEYDGVTIGAIEPVELDVVRWHHLTIEVVAGATEAAVREQVQSTLFDATAPDRDAGRLCAVRVTLQGAAGEADDWRVFLVGQAQHAGDRLWIEKVVLQGAQPIGGRQELEHLRALADTLVGGVDARDGLAAVCERLRKELRGVDPLLVGAVEALPSGATLDESDERRLYEQALRVIAGELERARR